MNTSSALVLFVVFCCVTFGRSQPTTTPSSSTSELPEVTDNSQPIGGFSTQDVNDKKFFDLATTAVGKLDALKAEKCELKVSKIVDAQSQVVAGTRYILKAKVCSTAMCDGKQQTPECDTCMMDLWDKPWMKFLQVSKFECPNQKQWSYTYKE